MRLKLNFDLENEFLPMQYRKSVISFIKQSLSEYNVEYLFTNSRKSLILVASYNFLLYFINILPYFKFRFVAYL